MVCLVLEPMVAGWKAKTNLLSYGSTHINVLVILKTKDGSKTDRKSSPT